MPTMRRLVQLALACDSAEQMGDKLRQRFQRQQRRAAGAQLSRADHEAEAELDRLLADMPD
jgi:hypothetical protein